MIQNNVNIMPAAVGGQFIRGVSLPAKEYIASEKVADNPIVVGSFARATDVENEVVGQIGNTEVIGFVFKQGYKDGYTNNFHAGESVLIEIGNMSIYALNLPEGVNPRKNDFIALKNSDGSLFFTSDKTQITQDYTDTKWKVYETNAGKQPGVIFIKKD